MVAESMPQGQLHLEKAATVLKALADPYRLRILDLLAQGEAGHSELQKQVGLPGNLLSHHLRVLRQVGFIRSRHDTVDARWIYYTLDLEALARWQSWLTQFLDPERVYRQPAVGGPEGRRLAAAPRRSKRKSKNVKRSVLFLCTGNSCRSQMAEAIVNTWLGDEWEAVSAGTRPAKAVHPKAIETLAEMGIEWQGHSAKHADNFRANSFDLVVTLCDNARRNRPAWLGQSVHLGFPDPAKVTGSEEEVRAVFRAVRDAMVAQVPVLLREQAG